MRVMTPLRGHLGQVGAEILATGLAVMLRVGDVEFLGSPSHQVTDIMQGSREHVFARRRLLAARTGPLHFIARFFDHLGRGQIFNPCKRRVGLILTRPQFG